MQGREAGLAFGGTVISPEVGCVAFRVEAAGGRGVPLRIVGATGSALEDEREEARARRIAGGRFFDAEPVHQREPFRSRHSGLLVPELGQRLDEQLLKSKVRGLCLR